MQKAIFGGGCFWCTESVFQHIKGVQQVESGYAGGQRQNPNYEQVCSGATGHAEVIRINFDEQTVSYAQLLDVFFATHDATTLNRQGNDIGTQYRSVIFYLDTAQKQQAQDKIAQLKADGINVVTELAAAPEFYSAEEYHQNFFDRNPTQPYCNFAIPPKIEKLQTKFPHLFKG
ncbi:MAG: peptide-methionine (S)-S-oxide reductase MsrA [Acinetobacter populi]|jgi:peptide-methionine (S)-S-oxide reductase|uniref:peptide-methionine (S)-S-oxide reductase MsrA n=1 Tax=Acinetobacter populi TaxID=1582270 RepID=UPI0023566696|nr:peptide-methionine (S)-S-oxide reductase MsrA [Acinetobacter populi]MCH4246942.1 peptide-methionine (S)-S-oxide reductase MsrA [Acinetobacter populi]